MTLLEKILGGLLVITLLAFGGFVFFKDRQVSQMQSTISSSLITQANLIDNIQRSSSTFATKTDLDSFAQQQGVNLAAIQKDLDSLNATVSGLNVVVVNSTGQNQTNVPSSNSTPNPNPPTPTTIPCTNGVCPGPLDIFKYTQNIQTLALNEDFTNVQVPFGSVSFDASQAKPWSETVYPRTYDITNTVGTNATSGQMAVYNQLSITSNGKTQTVPITTSKFVQQVPASTFSFWNPRLYLFANGAVNVSSAPLKGDFTPGVAVGIMSYGSTKVSPDISVLQVGAGYSTGTKNATVVLNPVSFNVGKLIPGHIVDNTMVGPSMEVDTKGNVMLGAGISVGF